VHGLATLRAEGVLRTDFPDQDLDEILTDAVGRTARMLVTEFRRP
jgi:hypothetical protein